MNTDELIKIIEREEIARKMLQESDLSVEKIAALTGVPIKDVKEIKEELSAH
jgi:hypothetical protein